MVGLQDESGLPIQILDPNHSTNTDSTQPSASSLLEYAHTEEDISILEAIYSMPDIDGDGVIQCGSIPHHHFLLIIVFYVLEITLASLTLMCPKYVTTLRDGIMVIVLLSCLSREELVA